MISTDTPQVSEKFYVPDENYESNRIKSNKEEGLRFVPEDTGPKVYCVVCKDASDWNEIHGYITNENEIDGIPNRKIDCSDECKTSDRMASYVISDEEAEQLKNHPKVFGVNLDPSYYSGTFRGLGVTFDTIRERYASDVKMQLKKSGTNLATFLPSSPGSDLLSRTDAAIYRHQQKDNPWRSIDDTSILVDNPEYNGDGTGIDLVVCDSGAWYGHIEFIKTGVGEPTNFIGTNVLKSEFASSATTGVCGVLDIVLDGPYYLDPDFFEASPSTRLTTRWDGTKVPVETVARNWWRFNSTSYRSSKYVSGTATGNADFGNVWVNTLQSRARTNGTNTNTNTNGGTHGTPCMSLAYGKTHGWAFNANKWHMNINSGLGAQTTSNCFKILKIFHQNKPNNPILGTKDPTMTSHSWGTVGSLSTIDGSTTGYHYFRKDGTGSGSNAGTSYTNSNEPAWLNNFDTARTYVAHLAQSYSDVIAAKDAIDAGVILFAASGNCNQKQVLDGHPDYDNYETNVSSSTTLTTALTDINRLYYNGTWISNLGRTAMINRPGFPAQAGMYTDGNGKDVYPSFNIGILNHDLYYGMEYKASMSNMGESIDCWCSSSSVIAAKDPNNSYTYYNRYDAYYRIDSNYDIVTSGGTQSDESETQLFGGTSVAAPVVCGLVATVLQHHRDWTWVDIKNWLKNEIKNPVATTGSTIDSGAFWSQYAEATTATDSKWNSNFNVHDDSKRKVIYMQRSGGLNISGLLNIKDGQLTIK